MSRNPSEQTSITPAPSWQPQPPTANRGAPKTLGILGAVLGALGLIVGVAAWFRAAPAPEADRPVYTEQQVTAAKKAVCDAYAKGMRSIRVVAKRQPANEADRLGVAVNSRVGEVAVATYFLNTLESNVAAPKELDDKLHDLANQYQELSLIQLADGGPSDWESVTEKIDELVLRIDQICQ